MAQEECKGGDCPLRPQFEEGASEKPEEGKKVRLSTGKYVQLLIDARETDPDCWPPGLEEAAGMIERARAIEDECIQKWGEFDPDKLSREQNRKYLEIQLALDALQEEACDAPLNIESALSEARANLAQDEAEHRIESHIEEDAPTPPSTSQPAGYALPTPPTPAHSEGFFAAALDSAEQFFIARSLEPDPHSKAAEALRLSSGWVEMPPPQRGDNYA